MDHGVIPSPKLSIKPLMDSSDPRRLRALLVDVLKREGSHTFVHASYAINMANNRLEHFPDWKKAVFRLKDLTMHTKVLSQALQIVGRGEDRYLYLKDVYDDKRAVEKVLRDLVNRKPISIDGSLPTNFWHSSLFDKYCDLAKAGVKEYQDAIKEQAKVCKGIFNKPLCVVSGPAGTGKTTIIRALIEAVELTDGKGSGFQLLAPTGKAADRIREKTGREASTIHSFLAREHWINVNLTISREGGNVKKDVKTYIIDESSMLDLRLVAALFRAIEWRPA